MLIIIPEDNQKVSPPLLKTAQNFRGTCWEIETLKI